jgi:hypothetical protein
MVVDERHKVEIVNEALAKSGEAISPMRDGQAGSDWENSTYYVGV